MTTNDNGGPAFRTTLSARHEHYDGCDVSSFEADDGLSVRDYFAAHAPADPQRWFEPAMATARPKVPPLHDGKDHPDESDDHVAECALCRSRAEAFDARQRWDKERNRQLYIQWPYAWADAMLAERKRSSEATECVPEAIDREQARWQVRIQTLLRTLVPSCTDDGTGCESGDPLDVTLAQIRVAFATFDDEHLPAEGVPDRAELESKLTVAAASNRVFGGALTEIAEAKGDGSCANCLASAAIAAHALTVDAVQFDAEVRANAEAQP